MMNNIKFGIKLYPNGTYNFNGSVLIYLFCLFNGNNYNNYGLGENLYGVKCNIKIIIPQIDLINYSVFTFTNKFNTHIILPYKHIYNRDLFKVNLLDLIICIDVENKLYDTNGYGNFRFINNMQNDFNNKTINGNWRLTPIQQLLLSKTSSTRIITSEPISNNFALQIYAPNDFREHKYNIQIRLLMIFCPFNIQSITCHVELELHLYDRIKTCQNKCVLNTRKNGKKNAFFAFNVNELNRKDIFENEIKFIKYNISKIKYHMFRRGINYYIS